MGGQKGKNLGYHVAHMPTSLPILVSEATSQVSGRESNSWRSSFRPAVSFASKPWVRGGALHRGGGGGVGGGISISDARNERECYGCRCGFFGVSRPASALFGFSSCVRARAPKIKVYQSTLQVLWLPKELSVRSCFSDLSASRVDTDLVSLSFCVMTAIWSLRSVLEGSSACASFQVVLGAFGFTRNSIHLQCSSDYP